MGGCGGGLCFTLMGAAITLEAKMVRGFVVGKTHPPIATLDDTLMVVVLCGGLLLRLGKSVWDSED